MDTLKFGQFIAERRRELGLKQQELAQKLNVTDKAVSRWENGRGFPDINTLEPLAEALGVSVVELMKSERLEEPLTPETADTALADTIEMAGRQTKQKRVMAVVTVLAVIVAVVVIPFFAWQIWAYNNPIVSIGYGIPTTKSYYNGRWTGGGLVESYHFENSKMVVDKYADSKWKYYQDGEWLDIEPEIENWYFGTIENVKARSIFGVSKTWELRNMELVLSSNTFIDDIINAHDKKPYLFLSRAETIGGHTFYTYIGYYTENNIVMPYYKTFDFNFKVTGSIENPPEEYFDIIWEKVPELKEAFESRANSGIWMSKYNRQHQSNGADTDWVSFTIENGTTAIWYAQDESEH